MTRQRWMILLFATILSILILKAFAFSIVELKGVSFSYRPEVEPQFLHELTDLKTQKGGRVSRRDELELYNRLYHQAGTDVDFDYWSPQGGVAPKQFRLRVKVKNYGDDASEPVRVNIALSAKVGHTRLEPDTLMLDQEYLQETAQWQTAQLMKGTIPVLARNESYEYFSEPIFFEAYASSLKEEYPVALKATVYLDNRNQEARTIELPVNPKSFILE